ncbi:hypothetical protein N0V82_003466 [Gnomoniopsis sp. IMI 355080]|nr:hypothetical protein N0V82_003466 [Gnomoniopsis sp. IMI 355080]
MSDNAEGVSDAQVTFKVKASGEKNHNITMNESATVADLKNKLATEEFENIPIERQRLIYSGRVMKNDDTLGSYKIKAGNTIHLVKSAASNPTPAPSSAASQPVPQAVPSNMAAGTSADNLLAGLTGARFAGHANLPSANIFGADGGMGAPPNEDQIADLLSNPNIAQQMNEALNNPAVVDMMIQANPMLRDNPQAREMLNSPFFRSMMTNPDLLRAASALRRGAGGPGAASAFPAPGATDNTPAGAPAAGTEGANNAQTQQNPFPGFGAFGVPPATGGGGANNPFAALFNPAAAQPGAGGAQAPSGNAATNPLAGLFGAGPPGAGGAAANPFDITPEMMQQFMGMMGGGEGMGGMGGFGAPPAPADNRPPEERYADQLRQLNDMGFFDFDQNVAALRRSGGNVQGAVHFLLGG